MSTTIWLMVIVMLVLVTGCTTAQPLQVNTLRCETLPDPVGVDVAHPRLSWLIESTRRSEQTTACQVLVASSVEELSRDHGDQWDSGKISAGASPAIDYAGNPLRPATTYFWKVRTWNRADQPSDWSEAHRWTTGLLQAPDWKATWIAHPADAATTKPTTGPMPIFRRSFKISKPVARALVFYCGLGQSELRLNGQKVGDDVIEPGWTNYKRTCLYVSRDITSLLQSGENVVGVMLGNGMYNVPDHPPRYQKFQGTFGVPKVIAQIQIHYADGSSETIATDPTWKSAAGPITFSSVFGGEDFDAQKASPNWDAPGFDDSTWKPAAATSGPGGTLAGTSRSAPPIRIADVFKVQKITEPQPGVFVYDFGQNASAIPHIELLGQAGQHVTLRPSELLQPNGTVNFGMQTYYTYTLATDQPESWSPRFQYQGYRYLELHGGVPEGYPNPNHLPVVKSIQSQFVTSTSEPVGEFACSNELFTQTCNMIRWAMRSNMMSVLTDCPHREKLGWLEQNHLVGASLMYNFDVRAMFNKVCWDMHDAQRDSGLVPDIAPEYTVFQGGFVDSPEWGSACVLIPWQVYEFYGDDSLLRTHYTTMKRYLDYLSTRAKDHILSHGLGDWYDLGPQRPGHAQLTPMSLTATAFYFRDAQIVANVAKMLGHSDEAARYTQLASEIRDAFNKSLYHADKKSYATGSQCANAIPLVFGLVPAGDEAGVLASLVADIEGRDNALTAGDVGYRYVLRALAQNGRSDVIFNMNCRSDRPGYGYMLKLGATSLIESWDGRDSQNHFMLGHIMEWFYHDLAGIQNDPSEIGFKKLIIRPNPVGDITWARASYRSVHGEIRSSWKKEGDRFTLDVTIPPGTTAKVYVPASDASHVTESGRSIGSAGEVQFMGREKDRIVCTIASGTYHFDVRP